MTNFASHPGLTLTLTRRDMGTESWRAAAGRPGRPAFGALLLGQLMKGPPGDGALAFEVLARAGRTGRRAATAGIAFS